MKIKEFFNDKKFIYPIVLGLVLALFVLFAVVSEQLVVMDISVNEAEISLESASVKVSASGETYTVKNGAASHSRKYYKINETDKTFIRQLLSAFCWDEMQEGNSLRRNYGLSYLTVDGIDKGLFFETQSLSHVRKETKELDPAGLFEMALAMGDTDEAVNYFVYLQITGAYKNINEDYEFIDNHKELPDIVPKRVEYSFNTYPANLRYMTFNGERRTFTPEDFGIDARYRDDFLRLSRERYERVRSSILTDDVLLRAADRFSKCIVQVNQPERSGMYKSDNDFSANDYYLDAVNSFKEYLKLHMACLDEYYESEGQLDTVNIAENTDEGFSKVYTTIENGEKLYMFVKDNMGYFYLPAYADADFAKEALDKERFKDELSKLNDVKYLTASGNAALFISTANNTMQFINESKENREPGEMTVYSVSGDKLYSGSLERVKGKGHSSFTHADKKNYRVIFNSPASFLGFDEADEIIMVANALDGTRLRNKAAYNFAQGFSMQVPSPRVFTEVYFNGRYWGNYLLLTPVRAPQNAEYMFETCVDEERNNENNVYFTDKNNVRYEVDYPEDDPAAAESIHEILNAALLCIEDESADIDTLSKYIDVDSFAKQYIINTLFDDVDANSFSTFFYIDDEGILSAGPVWDFDLTLGNHGQREEERGDDSYIQGIPEMLIKNQAFKAYVKKLYDEKCEALIAQALDEDFCVDDAAKASLAMDFSRWSYLARTPADMKEHSLLVDEAAEFLLNRNKILKERLK